MEALDIALTYNTCVYTDNKTSTYARPNRGTVMGPNHACDYVDVFVSELDRKLVSTCLVPLLSSLLPRHLQEQYRYRDWSRFRDDGFAILLDSEHLQPFTGCLQPLHPPNIKWTVSHGKTASYLDVSLSLKDGKIITDVFSKHNHFCCCCCCCCCCQAHHCGAFIQKHSSIVTVFLSLTHSHVFVWFFPLTCTSCTMALHLGYSVHNFRF